MIIDKVLMEYQYKCMLNTAGNDNLVHFCGTSFGCAVMVIFVILILQTLCSPLDSLVNVAFGVTYTFAQEKLEYHVLMI